MALLNSVLVLIKLTRKNLKKRVQSYFRSTGLNSKTLSMVQKISTIEVICTETEHEALVLENALIKKWRPRYNISLKDDKTYPYIYLSKDPFPKIGVITVPGSISVTRILN